MREDPVLASCGLRLAATGPASDTGEGIEA